ncbi:MAG: hypothetical protein KF847_12060 [Pirellulales bacterium]|nr:hypothetical protein [Pirellulales bacterium]
MSRSLRRIAGVARLALLFAAAFVARSTDALEQKFWGVTPYRVRVEVAVDAALRPEPQLAERLAAELAERIDGAIGPLWRLEIVATEGPRRWSILRELDAIDRREPTVPDLAVDKLLLLAVRAERSGWRIAAREYDDYLRRWGEVGERTAPQRELLGETCFEQLVAVFSPLLLVRPLDEDDERVELLPRGRELPTPAGEALFLRPGQPLQPLIRRTDRAGELLPDGVSNVPWTYLEAIEPQTDGSWLAEVRSGIRRPFRARRRGQFEQLAVGLHPSGDSTTVRFYARNNPATGLAGYEVFRKLPGDQGTELVGVTNRDGEATIPRYAESVSTLFLRSDGQLLARIPVVSGTATRVEAPIADDGARLRAQAELRTVREDLIDLVARRAILMGRVRAYLNGGRLDDAKRLMTELSGLATVAEYSRRIDVSQRANRSPDPQVQERIDAMFADTRSLLAKFLSMKQITELQAEVNQASAAAATE